MKRYMKVQWLHSFPNEPVLLYSELDEENMEIRKVEVFRDNQTQFADQHQATGDTGLGQYPVPPLDGIVADEEFVPEWIDKAEFERIWSIATQQKSNES